MTSSRDEWWLVATSNRELISNQEAFSPTAALESVLITSVIDAFEERDVAIIDIPNAFIQTRIVDDADKAVMRM